MQDHLNEEAAAEFKSVYKSFTKDDISPMPNVNLGTCLRTLGYFPSEADLQEMMEEYDPEGMGWIELASFLQLMAKKYKEPAVKEGDVNSAFKTFDRKGNGFVSVAEMKHLLATVGEPFNDEEMTEFIKYSLPDMDEQINYDDFVSRMMAKSKRRW